MSALGEIDRYLDAVGSRPKDGDTVAELLAWIKQPWDNKVFTEGSDRSSFYLFRTVGTELEFLNQRLRAASLFVQGVEDEYMPYPRPLFDDFTNEATQDQVEAALGKPEATGEWDGVWIRYAVGGKHLRFEFDDTGKLWSVGAALPI